MKVNNMYYALALTVLSSVACAKDITVNKNIGKAMDRFYDQLAFFKATDELNADFMAIHEGMKEDKWVYSEKVYQSAFQNAVDIASPENMNQIMLKHVQKPLVDPAQGNLVSELKKDPAALAASSCCGECTQITNDMLPLFIDQPGKYCFAEDLNFTPPGPAPIGAIIIIANDVSIDMCGHKLQQTDQNFLLVTGFQLVEGFKNIEIKNGTICNFQAAAINAFVFEEQLALDTLCFSNLTITDNGDGIFHPEIPIFTGAFASGINLSTNLSDFPAPQSRFAYRNVTIKDCKINRNSWRGVTIEACAGIATIENSEINDTFLDTGLTSVIGLVAFNSTNIRMKNCSINNTAHNDPEAPFNTVGGFSMSRSKNVVVENCQANDTSGKIALLVAGAFLSNVSDGQITNTQFNNSVGGENPNFGIGSRFVEAIHMTVAFAQEFDANGIVFRGCQFNGARRDGLLPGGTGTSFIAGIEANTLKNVVFEECQVARLFTEAEGYNVFGFFIRSGDSRLLTREFSVNRNITFKNCIASDLTSGNGLRCLGYQLFVSGGTPADVPGGNMVNSIFDGCIAENIHALQEEGRAAGIDISMEQSSPTPLVLPLNVIVKKCKLSDIKGEDGDSAGIYFDTVKNPVICDTIINDCTNGILLTGQEGIRPADTFQLANTEADALAEPPIFIDFTSAVNLGIEQTFENTVRGNEVNALPNDFATPIANSIFQQGLDLNALGWESGDEIIYHTNASEPIEPLVDGETYFLIVHTPGFTDCGLVQDNKITNCDVAGIRDDRCPTGSAFICNTAFKNGTPSTHRANYDINWEKCSPVCKGTLKEYPTCEKPFNISIIPCKDKCREASHDQG